MMTRNEAIALFNASVNTSKGAEGYVDFLIKSGILKVEEEKTVEEKVLKAMSDIGVSFPALFIMLDNTGLKIVEK